MSTVETFHHLRRTVEAVNALAATLVNAELRKMEEQLTSHPSGAAAATATAAAAAASPGIDFENHELLQFWNFSPESGNVIFASAYDCWGFGIGKFATLWAKRTGCNRKLLQKYLFEDYSFNSTTKKIASCLNDSGERVGKPMFATMILDPIYQIYTTCLDENDPVKAAKMAARGVSMMMRLMT